MSGESRFPRILSRRDKRRGQSKVGRTYDTYSLVVTLQASCLGISSAFRRVFDLAGRMQRCSGVQSPTCWLCSYLYAPLRLAYNTRTHNITVKG